MRPLVAGSLILALGCQPGAFEPLPTLDELRSAPTALVIAGRQVPIELFLWRDFMPISPPDGKPLAAVIRLPSDVESLEVTKSWVLQESLIWVAAPSFVAASTGREWVARGGPKWGPGVDVEVIVRVRDASGGAYLVRTPNVPINRTD